MLNIEREVNRKWSCFVWILWIEIDFYFYVKGILLIVFDYNGDYWYCFFLRVFEWIVGSFLFCYNFFFFCFCYVWEVLFGYRY